MRSIESSKRNETDFSPPRGTRDFGPSEKMQRDWIVQTLKTVFETYGFAPLETPALEKWETLSSKYAGGKEILKEMYSLTDQGGRKLGLRYDLTVPLCRFIAQNPKLAKPFKRYQIAPVWRDGPIKLGRYREFWQADVDTVGIESLAADAEVLSLALAVFKELGLDAFIKVNNRKLLDGLLDFAGVAPENRGAIILSLDKLDKIGKEGVLAELEQKGLAKESVEKLVGLLECKTIAAFEQMSLNEGGREGVKELKELFRYLDCFEAEKTRTRFAPSLARGLSYYTGTVFEVFLQNSAIKSAVAAGGRYDELIGNFTGRERIPATGISFGIDVLMDAMKIRLKSDKKQFRMLLYVIPIKTLGDSIKIVQAFRNAGIPAGIDLLGRGLSKNLEYASKSGVRFAAIAGEKELEQGRIRVRDMESGEEKELSVQEAINFLKNKV
ncbi:histidine--tRNA ligase [Candidatus Micrarchaeota archaeon]|nr:histidine--tRNA ligase [Candidatus Micrarchaeota archaeon]